MGRILEAGACALLLAGCGGGLPLLHPARTLPTGEVRGATGFSGNVATGGFADALAAARVDAAAGGPGPPGTDETYARGALVAASIAPGIAPLVGARVGIGAHYEGGLAYTGRAARADVRRAWDLSRAWTLSVGAGGSSALYGHSAGVILPDVDLGAVHGWGADVPLVLGYESEGGLYTAWLGARGGWEHVDISQLTSEPKDATLGVPPVTLSATRFWGGGLFGFAIGFRHVHVAMELDAAWANITGDFDQTHTHVSGVTLAPASAVWWSF